MPAVDPDLRRTWLLGPGATEILPVCETALGAVDVCQIAAGSARIRAALLGVEDLAAGLRAERGPDALEIDHAQPLNAALTPGEDALRRARVTVAAFEAARARGEDRALVDRLWVEVPTYRNARRLIERADRLKRRG